MEVPKDSRGYSSLSIKGKGRSNPQIHLNQIFKEHAPARGLLKRGVIMKTYNIQDVINAEFTLEPLQCSFCGSLEVTYLQYVGDAQCAICGEWQTDETDETEV
jgi:hypothetical protein